MKIERIKKDYYQKALQYVEKAKQILCEKARKEGNYYSDAKYVKMACKTAWKGVLVALNGKMKHEGCSYPLLNRMDVDIYREYLDKKNKGILKDFNSAFNYLYLYGGHEGDLYIITSHEGIQLALKIIEWCKIKTKSKEASHIN